MGGAQQNGMGSERKNLLRKVKGRIGVIHTEKPQYRSSVGRVFTLSIMNSCFHFVSNAEPRE